MSGEGERDRGEARMAAMLAQLTTSHKPTRTQIEAARKTLLWLSTQHDDPEVRDMIGIVRHELAEELDRRDAEGK